jgi:hypothetical protein
MAKIIYFTASDVPTVQEKADIEAINASIHTLNVSNGSVSNGLGTTEECDYVAGTVPTEYAGKPTFDPNAGELDDDQAIVTDGDSVTVHGASVTLAVSGNAITGTTLPATSAVVASGNAIPVQNSAGAAIGSGTLTVAANQPSYARLPATVAGVSNSGTVAVRNSAGADSHNATAVVATGALTGVNLAATVAMVDNSDAVTIQNSAGAGVTGSHTATVAAGVLSNVKLDATVAPIVNGASFTAVDGGTITVAVAAGVPTFTYTAP